MGEIGIKPKKEEYFIYKNGRFNLKTKTDQTLKFEREIPPFSGRFQINRNLYIGGGTTSVNGRENYISEFFTLDYNGKSKNLNSLLQKRACFSLAS